MHLGYNNASDHRVIDVILLLMYKTAVYTLVNGAITHQKPQI